MNMKISTLFNLCILTLLIYSPLIAQRSNSHTTTTHLFRPQTGPMNTGSITPYHNLPNDNSRYIEVQVEGSAYHEEAYTWATIIEDGKPGNKAFLRYNAFRDYLEIRVGKRVYKLPRKESIEANIAGNNYCYMEYQEGNEIKSGYLVELVSGELTFYKKPVKIFKHGRAPVTGYDVINPPRFVDNYAYFLREGDGPVEEVNVNNRFIKDLFGDMYFNAEEYANNNDLKMKDPEDLAQLIDWFNQL